ncbi:MAG: hypothetical protein CMJ27_12340 [Phycisphaerae bacterium]|nr:hypothetical protein [Phycisphaerae bacterium]OUX00154.1 MAG: hypothetical protein CBD91_07265 [Phycisphaeraceae bacterium TMED231]
MSARGPIRRSLGDFATTLWDLLHASRTDEKKPPAVTAGRASSSPTRPRGGQQAKYEALVASMKRRYGLRVVRWRSSTSGCAWTVAYGDGSVARLIESPRPRGPMSCAVFLHEVGHHAIGLGTYRPRCLEEYHAWRWSLETMLELGFNVTEAVRRRRDESLHYAIAKARRRGLKRLPGELVPFLEPRSREVEPLPALLEEVRGPALLADPTVAVAPTPGTGGMSPVAG